MVQPLSVRSGLTLALLATPLLAQGQGSFAKSLANSPKLGKVSAATFLADATRDGLIRNAQERSAAKRAFAAATERGRKPGVRGRRGNAFNTQPTPLRGLPAGSGPQAAITETEWNDSTGWADDMTGQTVANGAMSANTDKDFYRFVVPTDSVLTLSVTGGTPSVDDPDLELLDANGFQVEYNDDSAGLFPGMSLVVPAGTYYAAIGCPYAVTFGNYVLNVTTTPTTIPTIASGVLTNATLNGLSNPTYRLLLGADSRVTSTVAGGALDLYMDIRTATGQTFRFADDTSAGLDPGFNSNLPAGVYYVTFGEYNASSGPFTFTFTATAAAMPTLSCTTSSTGTIVGDEDWDLRRITLATQQRVTFASAGNGATPMTDTVMHLLDANLREFAFNDESSASSFAFLDTPLPAGTYYVAYRGYFGDAGGYSLTSTCGQPATVTPAAWGLTQATFTTPGLGVAYSFQVRTDVPVEVNSLTPSTSTNDTQMAILDANGLCRGYDDDSFGTFDSKTGAGLAEGTYWVLARDWYNAVGGFDLFVNPPLYFEDAVNNRTLTTLDKAGNNDIVFVTVNLLPFGLPLPPPIQGKLLIDVSIYVQLGPLATPASGTMQWTPSLQAYPGLVAQAVSVTPSFTSARMTDVVK